MMNHFRQFLIFWKEIKKKYSNSVAFRDVLHEYFDPKNHSNITMTST